MPRASLVSVVEDDQFFRESMRRLMRSLGYDVAAFPSAADFLASPRLDRNRLPDRRRPYACDDRGRTLRTPHRGGYAIPTILVTAYPDDVDRARAMNDGVVCYLRKPLMRASDTVSSCGSQVR